MKETCGILLYDIETKTFLVGHPTNSPRNYWSIPKGQKEPNETTFAAAIREMYEETNIDYDSLEVISTSKLGTYPYQNKKKKLTVYAVMVKGKPSDIKCNTYVDNQDYFEMDDFQWIEIDNLKINLHPTQLEALNTFKNGTPY